MDEKPRSLWKLRLVALIFGLLTLGVVYGGALLLTNDVRLIYVSGAVLLFCASIWIGRKQEDWLAAVFLAVPLMASFCYLVLTEVPVLWPNLVFWSVTVAIGLVSARIARARFGLAIFLVAALLIGSTWYCAGYIPKQLARLFNHVTDASAPTFKLQPVSEGSVPVAPQPGKILVVDFFSTTCGPCIAELPQFAAARADLSNNRDIEFVLVASDLGRDTPNRFRSFVESRHINLPLAFDEGGKAHDGLGLHGVPAIIVFDRNGKIRLTREGYNAAETSFRQDLVAFLKTL
jgi:thiol-disulfide isomerase/thioredoxin